jgi:dihydroorotase
MLNRRQFLSAVAAGAARFVRAPRAFAGRYDLIIRGGRVIDPSVRLDAIRDVAISGGRIVAVESTSRATQPTPSTRAVSSSSLVYSISTPTPRAPRRGPASCCRAAC